MSELTSVAVLMETTLQQKLQECRRELKWRVDALRTHLWTILEVLDNDHMPLPQLPLMDYAREIGDLVDKICIAEQMLEQIKNPRVRAQVQAIDELQKRQDSEIEQGRITLVGCYTKVDELRTQQVTADDWARACEKLQQERQEQG